MKFTNRNLAAPLLVGCILLSSANAKDVGEQRGSAAANVPDKQKTSYAIGVDMGRNFKRLDLDLDLDMFTKGLKDGNSGNRLDLSEEELHNVLNAHQTELKRKQAAAHKAVGDANQKAGEEFLAANAKKADVVSLPSGLQYKVLKQGKGKIPTIDDSVACHYRGTLLNGVVFDSSYSRGRPAIFKVKDIIPGWQEALLLMPEGSKWQLFIPPHLAYADKGAGRDVGPNATLVFEVELLGVVPAGSEVPTAN